MRKFYSFLTLILIGLYVIYLYIDPRRIFTFTTERYFYVILGSGILLLVFGIVGILINLKDLKFKRLKDSLQKVFTDKKLILIIILSALGFFISPVFFLICTGVTLLGFKNGPFDSFLQKDILKQTLLLIVIIIGVVLPSSQISSSTAGQRIGNLNSVVLDSNVQIENSFSSNTKNYDIGDWITSLSYNPDLSFYDGKTVEVIGFIFSPDNLPDDMFLVSRFVIRCCAADATPVGLIVEYPWQGEFKQDEWVKVVGKFEIRNINGFDDLVIVPESVERTEVPERPYIS